MGSIRSLRSLALALPLIVVAGCGGGGGGGGSSTPPAPSGTISVPVKTLNFTASLGQTPPAQFVSATVTGVTSPTLFIRIVASGEGVSSIDSVQITGPTSGQALVHPVSADSLGVGSHSGTISVSACTTDASCSGPLLAGSPQIVNVTYDVPGALAAPASLSFTLGDAPAPGDLQKAVNVSGFPNQGWTATSNVPWLQVTPSGTIGSTPQLAATLDTAQLASMRNGDSSGTVTITPAAGAAVSVPVSLTIGRTQITNIAPYVGTTGVSAKAIVRGDFTRVTVTGVQVGATLLSCPSDCSVVNGTEIDVTYPAFAAGTYPVQVQTIEAISAKSFANLVVVDAPVFAQKTLTYPDFGGTPRSIRSLAYDAERKALAVGIDQLNTMTGLLRYPYTSDWQTPTLLAPSVSSFIHTRDAALAADGKNWLLLADSFLGNSDAVYPLDASTFVLGAGNFAGSAVGNNGQFLNLFPTNDGNAVLTSQDGSGTGSGPVFTFSAPAPGFTPAPPLYAALPLAANAAGKTQLSFAAGGVSANGALVFFTQRLTTAYQYAASTQTLSATSLTPSTLIAPATLLPALNANPVIDRNGLRIGLITGTFDNNTGDAVTDVAVYDETYSRLGGLPLTTLALVFRPDPLGASTRVYTLDGCNIRAFDLAAPLVAGGAFSEIITASYPVAVSCPGNHPYMAITPDGGTVFVAGDAQAAVVPAP